MRLRAKHYGPGKLTKMKNKSAQADTNTGTEPMGTCKLNGIRMQIYKWLTYFIKKVKVTSSE
jgi:hypothetical protein